MPESDEAAGFDNCSGLKDKADNDSRSVQLQHALFRMVSVGLKKPAAKRLPKGVELKVVHVHHRCNDKPRSELHPGNSYAKPVTVPPFFRMRSETMGLNEKP
jgi:hypothetical protein